MGQEIGESSFSDEDQRAFEGHLRDETHLLKSYFEKERFSQRGGIAGFELEAWLVDSDYQPVPAINNLLKRLDNTDVVPELSKFNFEMNCAPLALQGQALSQFEKTSARSGKKLKMRHLHLVPLP